MRLNSKRAKHLRKLAKAQIENVDGVAWFKGYSFDNGKRPNPKRLFRVIQTLIQSSKTETQEDTNAVIENAKSYCFPPLRVASPSGKSLYRTMKASLRKA